MNHTSEYLMIMSGGRRGWAKGNRWSVVIHSWLSCLPWHVHECAICNGTAERHRCRIKSMAGGRGSGELILSIGPTVGQFISWLWPEGIVRREVSTKTSQTRGVCKVCSIKGQICKISQQHRKFNKKIIKLWIDYLKKYDYVCSCRRQDLTCRTFMVG